MHRSSAALALAALALTSAAAVLPTAPAVAAALPCEHTYSSGVVNTFISFLNPTGPTPTVSTIDVPEDGLVVDDIDVLVNVTHPAVWELKITLVSLTDAAAVRGTTKLTDITPGAGANLHGTVFDDAASIPLGAGVAPYTGRFRPFAPLSGLTGVSGGAWQLQIVDAAPGDDGGFDDWAVTLHYSNCDTDHDGVLDRSDSCASAAAATVSGCPVASRSLSASYRAWKFKGALSSGTPACRASRPVTVWKVRPGPDRRVGTATTRIDGSYRLFRPRRSGRYYVTSPALVVTDVAECRPVRSRMFNVG